ncbi:MAG: hypothetical protein FJ125_06965 [Deltaproteobacteria bacterium]|nr:hypothetical protein [Deltaproteobacteria bacterium]
MTKHIVALLLSLLLLASGAVAWAQQRPQDGETVTDPETGQTYAKRTVYDFEDDVVEGALVKPEGDYLDSRQRRKQSSLIKVRSDFIPEMLKSAEDL